MAIMIYSFFGLYIKTHIPTVYNTTGWLDFMAYLSVYMSVFSQYVCVCVCVLEFNTRITTSFPLVNASPKPLFDMMCNCDVFVLMLSTP